MKIILFLSSCLLLVQGNPFSAAISSMKCLEKCNSSFPSHTTTKVVELDACYRGCRFYTLVSVLKPWPEQPIVDECKEDCSASYQPGKNAHFGCVSGCESADILVKEFEDEQKLQAVEEEGHSMTPLYQIKDIVSRIFGNKQVLKTSVTTFLATDDNKIVAVKGPTILSVRNIPQENIVPAIEETDPIPAPSEINEDVQIEKLSVSYSRSPMVFFSTMLIIGFCIGGILYLFVSKISLRTASKSVSKPASNMPQIVPVKLVRPEDLTKLSIIDDDDMAGPLPPKIKLPDSHI